MPDSAPCSSHQRPLTCCPQIVDGLYSVARLLTDTADQPPKLDRIVQALEQLDLFRATIMLLGPDDRQLRIAAAQGVDPRETERIQYHRGEGIVGLVMETRQAITLVYPHLDPRFLNRVHRRKREITERITFICVPIIYDSRCIGTLSADIPRQGRLNSDLAVRLLTIVAAMIARRANELRPSAITSLSERIRTIEIDMINTALHRAGGNIAAAARMLGITSRMARYKIRQLGIQR